MELPVSISPAALGAPLYVGSVQRLYEVPGNEGILVCETTDGGSVFDVGTVFHVAGSDLSRAVFRQLLFTELGRGEFWAGLEGTILGAGYGGGFEDSLRREQARLAEIGARTHHLGMLDGSTWELVCGELPERPSPFCVVERFGVVRPEEVGGPSGVLFSYGDRDPQGRGMVPLEYIVRLGITGGSSVYRRYLGLGGSAAEDYARSLGVASGRLEAWSRPGRPVLDCSSKLEPVDRGLGDQEALMTSGLSGAGFVRSLALSLLGAWGVERWLGRFGIELWDLKWEFAHEGEEILFADTLDTDSLRATYRIPVGAGGRTLYVHLNKQAMRDYFALMHSAWMEGVGRAKLLASRSGHAVGEELRRLQLAGDAAATPEVDGGFLRLQSDKMRCVEDGIAGRLGAEEVKGRLGELARAEFAFYEERGLGQELLALNGSGA
jgi:phosphoribosylaminoimidazole-succinocarboxamide synthase